MVSVLPDSSINAVVGVKRWHLVRRPHQQPRALGSQVSPRLSSTFRAVVGESSHFPAHNTNNGYVRSTGLRRTEGELLFKMMHVESVTFTFYSR